MTSPKPTIICKSAIQHILSAMLKQDNSPCSAEMHLAQAVMILNQIAEIDSLKDAEMMEQLLHCRNLILGK